MALTAKYPAVCSICSGQIATGTPISKSAGRWVHASCTGVRPDAAADGPPAPGGSAAAERAAASPKAGRRGSPVRAAMPVAPGALQVWTDGACSGNPGPGGWAWATRDGRQDSGAEAATTNQRMEIRAALEAVRALSGPLVVISDSTYVVNCFRDRWWEGWLARGWVNSARKPVANRELWQPLIELVLERDEIAFHWVKGHSGDEMNDLVDRLAVQAGRAVRS